jgi:hypothetical protein
MEYLIGLLLALALAVFAATMNFDRDRSFAPTVLIVIAAYYVLFALMGASWPTVAVEIAIALAFAIVGVIGVRTNPMITAAAIVAHGLFDLVHHLFIDNPGMPRWWPGFCSTIDIAFGAWLALRVSRRQAAR